MSGNDYESMSNDEIALAGRASADPLTRELADRLWEASRAIEELRSSLDLLRGDA